MLNFVLTAPCDKLQISHLKACLYIRTCYAKKDTAGKTNNADCILFY